jgi:transposase
VLSHNVLDRQGQPSLTSQCSTGSHGGEATEVRSGEVDEDLGSNETTLASWVSRARRTGTAPVGGSDELERLRRENAQLKRDNKELGMERDALKRCMVL